MILSLLCIICYYYCYYYYCYYSYYCSLFIGPLRSSARGQVHFGHRTDACVQSLSRAFLSRGAVGLEALVGPQAAPPKAQVAMLPGPRESLLELRHCVAQPENEVVGAPNRRFGRGIH